jgi:hypothetical protein
MRMAQSQLAAAQAKLASDNGTYLHMGNAAKTPGVLAENDVAVAEETVAADIGNVQADGSNCEGIDRGVWRSENERPSSEIRDRRNPFRRSGKGSSVFTMNACPVIISILFPAQH